MWLGDDLFSKLISNTWTVATGILMISLPSFPELFLSGFKMFMERFSVNKEDFWQDLVVFRKGLKNLEETLTKEYDLLCNQEAILWQQKSRDKWLKNADQNTIVSLNYHDEVERRTRLKGYMIVIKSGALILMT